MPLRPARELKAERETLLNARDAIALEEIARAVEKTNLNGATQYIHHTIPSERVQKRLQEAGYRVKPFYSQKDGDSLIINWD